MSGWIGSLASFGALLVALASLWVTILTKRTRDRLDAAEQRTREITEAEARGREEQRREQRLADLERRAQHEEDETDD